ncbi:MAG TPA: tRNA-(ms[2]io[6]A)-hydroxylase [Myxococcota bacterium]|nr:tRNA-(ms[2]io[6]A)-hydroxylase [Myxococcota bacterium]
MEILAVPTPEAWLPLALSAFDAVLVDHAHCEKKAAASAIALVNQYPDNANLVRRCVGLAQEELRHFKQVHRIVLKRGLTLTRDPGDPYARALLAELRHGAEERLVDRLLVSSLIEARSCERLALLGSSLDDPELARFYRGLATAEAGHHRLFVQLALEAAGKAVVAARLAALAARESEIMLALPVAPRIH